ncbi:hypothetical protein BDV29DRAFT_159599 [Aspergillus leporis]|uniref:Hydrophobin n=1 Tax=Aspergillus leporis TaxID=41062 RepID=A0A5N5WVZ2_9EURO|nr:hypothetical protein BDV29DRAFT_159599 [Aspergillus leporis]
MKLNTLLTSASLAAAVLALPNYESQGHLDHPAGSELIKAPIPQSMTVKEAVEKCGEAAQLSCCNKVTYAGDTTVVGGGLSNILGSGSGSTGASLATECSYIHVPLVINVLALLNQECQQNVACCQKSSGSLCITLGSLL